MKSTEALVMVYLGGMGSLSGSVLSAVLFTLILEILRPLQLYKWVVVPLILILLMLFRTEGLLGHRELTDVFPRLKRIFGSKEEDPCHSLRYSGLTHFFGGLKAVSDFNLTFEGGELVGLIGPNGAGKTTIFNLICGVYRPTRGEVKIEGRSLVGLYPHQVTAMGIARTFQNIRLWPEMTVLDNIRVAHNYKLSYGFLDVILQTSRYRAAEKGIDRRAGEVLEILGLGDHAEELAKNLPYGLQRKVEIARALVIRPKLLLLDEPSAGMNLGEKEALVGLIRWIRKEFNLTIWLIEHEMRVVMNLCEKIQVLDFGETIAQGTPEEIQATPVWWRLTWGKRWTDASIHRRSACRVWSD